MNDRELWTLMREAWTALSPHYESAIEKIVRESGLEGRGWGLLLTVFTFEPDPTTSAHLLVRVPYTAADVYLARLVSAAQRGYLEEVDTSKYRLSPKGRTALRHFIKEARDAMTRSDPLPISDSKRLADLLDKLVNSCLATNPPPDTWSISLSFKLLPSSDPPMPHIEQEFSCLDAYRDDAHLAAWQQSGLSATSLEVLTLLWQGDGNSLNSIVKSLGRRGHSLWVYADALTVLRARNYITGDDDALTITHKGKAFRGQVETDTDRYFFAPWSSLSEAEKFEMEDLLLRMRDGLNTSALEL